MTPALNQFGNRVSAFAREVVARRALIVAAVGAGAHLLVVYGLLPDGAGPDVVDLVGQTIDFIAVAVGVFYIRGGVTPADPKLAPRSSDGQALVITQVPPVRPITVNVTAVDRTAAERQP